MVCDTRVHCTPPPGYHPDKCCKRPRTLLTELVSWCCPRPCRCCCCSAADTTGRGIVNFGQTLVWYSSYLLATSKQRRASSRQLLEQLEAQQWQ